MSAQVPPPELNPGSRLRTLYILCLSLVALLTILAQFFIQAQIDQQGKEATLASIAGSERMLSQRILMSALRITLEANDSKQAKSELRTFIKFWKVIHEQMEELSITQVGLTEKVNNLRPGSDAILAAATRLTSANQTSQQDLVAIEHAQQDYLKANSELASRLENDDDHNRKRLAQLEIGLAIVTILVLILEGYFVYRPVEIRLTKQFARLGDLVKQAQEAQLASEKASEVKSQFLANMSHEIRTPMNGVVGMANMLLESPLGPQQRTLSQTIVNSSNALLNILNDILDFSKLEAGKVQLEIKQFSVRELIEEVTALFEKEAYDKGIHLVGILDPTLPTKVSGDPTRIRQILLNIVGNAVKFTDTGEVQVICRPTAQSDWLAIEVIDTGIGMGSDVTANLFGQFFQADATTTRKYGGTGLGLAISKQLIDQMGGQINVKSSEGVGSHFTVEISLPTVLGPQLPDRENGEILYVEPISSYRQAMKSYLEVLGSRLVEAESLEVGIKFLSERKFDAIFVASPIPSGDLKHLQALRSTFSGPIFNVISVADPMSVIEDAFNFDGQIMKPFRLQSISEAIFKRQPVRTSNDVEEPHDLPWKHMKVLVVEDNTVNQIVVQHLVETLGAKVTTVESGESALDQVGLFKFDLILMDWHLPKMDGLSTTRAIREGESLNRTTKIVALTANAMPGDSEVCFEAGMNGYLTKPFSRKHLWETVENLN